MRRNRIIIQSLIGATVITGGMVALTPAAQADTIPVACSEDALVAAVTLANSTSAADTLTLASGCTYSSNGQEALPVVTTRIEMIGPARLGTALPYRRGQQDRQAHPNHRVAVTNGSAVGDGGAILDFGAVTLTRSSLPWPTCPVGAVRELDVADVSDALNVAGVKFTAPSTGTRARLSPWSRLKPYS